MPHSLKCKIKHLCHNGTITESERDRILKALDQEEILDKIRDEIDAESAKSFKYPNWERAKALEWALEIIDKYEEEKENG